MELQKMAETYDLFRSNTGAWQRAYARGHCKMSNLAAVYSEPTDGNGVRACAAASDGSFAWSAACGLGLCRRNIQQRTALAFECLLQISVRQMVPEPVGCVRCILRVPMAFARAHRLDALQLELLPLLDKCFDSSPSGGCASDPQNGVVQPSDRATCCVGSCDSLPLGEIISKKQCSDCSDEVRRPLGGIMFTSVQHWSARRACTAAARVHKVQCANYQTWSGKYFAPHHAQC